MNYYTELLTCVENIGVIIPEGDESDINLAEYQIDSLTFISLILEIESHFQIEIPDEYLSMQTVASLKGLALLIEVLCNNKK